VQPLRFPCGKKKEKTKIESEMLKEKTNTTVKRFGSGFGELHDGSG
jgi:hypothetical protein